MPKETHERKQKNKRKGYEIKPKVVWVGQHRKGHITEDAHVPKKYRKTLALHEKTEYELEKQKGLPYKTAHRKANEAEKKEYFTKDGKVEKAKWRAYEKDINKIYRANLAKIRKREMAKAKKHK